MREYIGHKIKCIVEGFPGPMTGILVREDPNFMYVKGEKDTWRIPKGKVCGFTPVDFEPLDYIPFHVLYCDNEKKDCLGVQYIVEGAGFSQKSLSLMMEPCPCKDETCRRGTKGELRTVSGAFLKKVLSGMLFGNYPEKKEKKNANGGRTSQEAERTQDEGGGTFEGEEPLDGGIGFPQEEISGVGEEVQG
jgi:hypothetical protein